MITQSVSTGVNAACQFAVPVAVEASSRCSIDLELCSEPRHSFPYCKEWILLFAEDLTLFTYKNFYGP